MPEPIEKYLDRALFYLFALFVFSSTFSIALAQISFGLSLLVFITLCIKKKYNPFDKSLRSFYLAIAAYVAWLLMTAAISYRPLYSLNLVKEDWLFLIVPVGVYVFRKSRDRDRIILALSSGVLLVSIYAIIQHNTGVNWFKDSTLYPMPGYGYRAAGNFATITFSNYFAMASVFLVGYALKAGREKLGGMYRFVLMTGFLAVLATVLSFGRGATIAVVGSLLALGLFTRRQYLKYVIGSLAIMVILVLIVSPGLTDRFTTQMMTEIKGEYEGSRIFIWKHSATIIADNPLVGVGTGNFKPAFAELLPVEIREKRAHTHAHNDFLNIAAISGLIGLAFFMMIWFILLKLIVKNWKNLTDNSRAGPFLLGSLLACIAFLISSLTEATFADEEVRQFLMFIWVAGLWVVQFPPEPEGR